MRKELIEIQKIENYLLGNASKEETAIIEEEMTNNPKFRAKVENQKLIIQAVKRKALRKEINNIGSSGFHSFWKWGLGFVIIAMTFYFLFNFISKEWSSQNNQEKIEYNFRGLKTWVEPSIQNFEVVAEDGATIEGKDGILIIIPENAFLDTSGRVVKGSVSFELIEAFSLEDMVLYNLTTTADGNYLETGGMFYINANQEGQQLTINPKRALYIEIPTEFKKDGMMAFKGEITEDGDVNWRDPIKLEKFLVQIDFENLDFLPSGFEDEVQNEPINSPFHLESKQQIDSLYYTILYANEKLDEPEIEKTIISRTISILPSNAFGVENDDVSRGTTSSNTTTTQIYETFETVADTTAIEEATVCYGIDPLTVKTIRTEEFENTLISTNEFEERIRELHKLEQGEHLIHFYINNLSKQMWEIDSLVELNLTGKEKQLFESFKEQKLTNLKDAKIYQERLSEYYNSKKQASRVALKDFKNEISKKDRSEINALSVEINNLQKELTVDFSNRTFNRVNNSIASNIPRSSVVNSNVYSMRWYSFGWANIDRYLKLINDNSKHVNIYAKTELENAKVYQWLDVVRTLTPIRINNKQGISVFPDVGSEAAIKMKQTQAIAISRIGTQYSWGHIRYKPYEVDSIEITLDTIDIEVLKNKLIALNIGADPLVKQIKTTQEILKEDSIRRVIIAKRSKIRKLEEELENKNEFERRLREICFGCQIRFADKPMIKEDIIEYDF